MNMFHGMTSNTVHCSSAMLKTSYWNCHSSLVVDMPDTLQQKPDITFSTWWCTIPYTQWSHSTPKCTTPWTSGWLKGETMSWQLYYPYAIPVIYIFGIISKMMTMSCQSQPVDTLTENMCTCQKHLPWSNIKCSARWWEVLSLVWKHKKQTMNSTSVMKRFLKFPAVWHKFISQWKTVFIK
jgi:hypothetical protein